MGDFVRAAGVDGEFVAVADDGFRRQGEHLIENQSRIAQGSGDGHALSGLRSIGFFDGDIRAARLQDVAEAGGDRRSSPSSVLKSASLVKGIVVPISTETQGIRCLLRNSRGSMAVRKIGWSRPRTLKSLELLP